MIDPQEELPDAIACILWAVGLAVIVGLALILTT